MNRSRFLAERADALFEEQRTKVFRWTDRMFAILMGAQWVFAIGLALLWSPLAWEGRVSSVHVHVYAALLLGGAVTALPIALVFARPGAAVTRHTIAICQMLWSALLIHLSGGRIETHFHVFGSLAFIAFYRDWKVLVPATFVVTADHLVRQIFWPQSVYGLLNPEWWRFVEHAFWVVFENVILAYSCIFGVREMRQAAERQAEIEALSSSEQAKSRDLDQAMKALRDSHDALIRVEKLAAIGQLAASVSHELRNPLTAVRNAASYVSKKIGDGSPDGSADPRLSAMVNVMEKELGNCNRIISDLLDFACERAPVKQPTPLRALVEDALAVVPRGALVQVFNEVPEALPIPDVDKDQFRQVLINLVQNAVEAIPADRLGTVRVSASGGGAAPWQIEVRDDGAGMPPDVAEKVFQPLYTTKRKGTGLGLAIVAGMVHRHEGTIRVDSSEGAGSVFTITLPPQPTAHRAAAA